MRNKFDEELDILKQNFIAMCNECEKAISNAVSAFLEGNNDYIKEAEESELKINEMEKEIEHKCLKLLLKQQPVAGDLRMISAALKMITDLERIGDQAYDIGTLTRYNNLYNTNNHIKTMAKETVKMVKNSVNAYVKSDMTLANQVIKSDDVIDCLFITVKNDLIIEIKDESDVSESILDTLMIAKYLERIADHATNISEWVIFSITGKHAEIKTNVEH